MVNDACRGIAPKNELTHLDYQGPVHVVEHLGLVLVGKGPALFVAIICAPGRNSGETKKKRT